MDFLLQKMTADRFKYSAEIFQEDEQNEPATLKKTLKLLSENLPFARLLLLRLTASQ